MQIPADQAITRGAFNAMIVDPRNSFVDVTVEAVSDVWQADIQPRDSPHILRHSFATGLFVAYVDLLTIGQKN